MQYPKISIVTPSYNQAPFLERTILSVINQNYPNLEYIIIDGSSTDGSTEIIKKYKKHIAYWVSEKDSGQSEAINKGFSIATGEIFAYLNSDDVYLNNALNIVSNYFEKYSNVDIIYGQAYLIDQEDRKLKIIPSLPFRLKEFLNGVFSIPQQSAFWKKTVFDKVGGFNVANQTCMDGEFFAWAAYKKFNFKCVDDFLGAFRIHKLSKTSNRSIQNTSQFQSDRINFISEISTKAEIRVNKYFRTYFKIKNAPIKFFKKIK